MIVTLLGGGAAFIACALACKAAPEKGGSPEPDAAPFVADQSDDWFCSKLEILQAARGCKSPERELFRPNVGVADVTRFSVVGKRMSNFRGTIFKYKTREQYDEFAKNSELFPVAADDYPRQTVLVPKWRIVVSWSEEPESAESKAWTACVKTKPPATCAKTHAEYYEALKTLHTAASRVASY
jgi:hypothetical protein